MGERLDAAGAMAIAGCGRRGEQPGVDDQHPQEPRRRIAPPTDSSTRSDPSAAPPSPTATKPRGPAAALIGIGEVTLDGVADDLGDRGAMQPSFGAEPGESLVRQHHGRALHDAGMSHQLGRRPHETIGMISVVGGKK